MNALDANTPGELNGHSLDRTEQLSISGALFDKQGELLRSACLASSPEGKAYLLAEADRIAKLRAKLSFSQQ